MGSKLDEMSKQSSLPTTIGEDNLYARFRKLGANVERLKGLGLALPMLQELLERLESIHDKNLVHFITTLGRSCKNNNSSSDSASIAFFISRQVLKTCPRCTREITDANIVKQSYYAEDEFISFVVVCECGYIREIRRPTGNQHLYRQSTLREFVHACNVFSK